MDFLPTAESPCAEADPTRMCSAVVEETSTPSTEAEMIARMLVAVCLFCLCAPLAVAAEPAPKPLHHYVFFGADREHISDASFLDTRSFEGAQIRYSWKRLEPAKDEYDFS